MTDVAESLHRGVRVEELKCALGDIVVLELRRRVHDDLPVDELGARVLGHRVAEPLPVDGFLAQPLADLVVVDLQPW